MYMQIFYQWLPTHHGYLNMLEIKTSVCVGTGFCLFVCFNLASKHSSILAWRIPWTDEPGGLQSMGSQRVGQD